MIKKPGLPVTDNFKLLKDLGYDGVGMDIENGWNRSLYQRGDDAPADQTPDKFIRDVDEINSTSVGIYFDLSNHRK